MTRKFRFHRGGYSESMATMIEVESILHLKAEIEKQRHPIQHLEVVKYGNEPDERNGWDTHIVLADGDPVGFADGPLPMATIDDLIGRAPLHEED